jgi:16S rRNA (cytosine1402-N4)-methyltransferase
MATHVPVLLREVMEMLDVQAGDSIIDATLGGGGYTNALLTAVAPHGRVLALDCDPGAIERVRSFDWAIEAGARLQLEHGSFGDVQHIVEAQNFPSPAAIVADLGWSSLQLADSRRGFSFQDDGPLDMRLDPTSEHPTAAQLLKMQSEQELETMIRTLGEERHAPRIARAIVSKRQSAPIVTTKALADLITEATPRRGKIHPATRTFQALRIAVNDELGVLQQAIPEMLSVVRSGGRIAIVSFHSLEDRIVKRIFRSAEERGIGTRVTKRPLRPSGEEITNNPRSRSARLRVFETTS